MTDSRKDIQILYEICELKILWPLTKQRRHMNATVAVVSVAGTNGLSPEDYGVGVVVEVDVVFVTFFLWWNIWAGDVITFSVSLVTVFMPLSVSLTAALVPLSAALNGASASFLTVDCFLVVVVVVEAVEESWARAALLANAATTTVNASKFLLVNISKLLTCTC